MVRRVGATVTVVLAFAGAGLSCVDEPTSGEANASYCQATDRLDGAVDEITAEGATPSERDDLLDAAADVEDAVTDVVDARADTQNPIDEFNTRLQEIPDDASLADALAGTARAGGSLLSDLQTFLDPPDC